MDGYQKYCDLIEKANNLKREIDKYEREYNKLIPNTKYEDEKTGLLFCSYCHTPMEKITGYSSYLNGKPYPDTTFIDCKCKEKHINNTKDYYNTLDLLRDMEQLQKRCFPDQSMTKLFLAKAQGNEKNIKVICKYADNWETALTNNIGLILWGNIGTGKTYAAACLANELICLYNTSVHMTNFATILNDLTSNANDRNEYVENLCKCDLLIIDDLGMERNTSFATEQVYNVIDTRYQTQKPLVITTNLTLDFIKNPQNIEYARIYDRILEMCTPIHFDGKNIRAEKAKEKFKVIKSFMGDDEKENER